MKTRFVWVATAVAFTLAPVITPVWGAPSSDSTTTVKDDARTAGHAVAHGATTVGHTVADKSKEAGHAVADHTRGARDTIRDDSKKAGHAIADGARSVGRAVREGWEKLRTGITGKSSEPAPKS